MASEVKTRTNKDKRLRTLLFNYEDRLATYQELFAFCQKIVADPIKYKDTIKDAQYMAPEVISSIVRFPKHPIHQIYLIQTCSDCRSFVECLPCSQCNREHCAGCNVPVSSIRPPTELAIKNMPDKSEPQEICPSCVELEGLTQQRKV